MALFLEHIAVLERLRNGCRLYVGSTRFWLTGETSGNGWGAVPKSTAEALISRCMVTRSKLGPKNRPYRISRKGLQVLDEIEQRERS